MVSTTAPCYNTRGQRGRPPWSGQRITEVGNIKEITQTPCQKVWRASYRSYNYTTVKCTTLLATILEGTLLVHSTLQTSLKINGRSLSCVILFARIENRARSDIVTFAPLRPALPRTGLRPPSPQLEVSTSSSPIIRK